MIIANLPDDANLALFLSYLNKCLRLLIEYNADTDELSFDCMKSVEDVVRNINYGYEALQGLNGQSLSFWEGAGAPLLRVIQKYYSTDYEDIIDERSKKIHRILGEKRHILMTDIVERMEAGDVNLIKQIAELFEQDDTDEGRARAKALLEN